MLGVWSRWSRHRSGGARWQARPVLPMAVVLLCLLAAPLRAAGLPALEALQRETGAAISALVVDLERGRTIAALRPDLALIPASVTKLYTAALALESWGPGKRFTTELLAAGVLRGDRLEGDLILRGGGDPALTNEGLWRLARDLAAAGLVEIAGDVIVDASHFGHVACSTRDRCLGEVQTRFTYDAPLSAAAVNYAGLALTLVPGPAAGERARISLDPYSLPHVEIVGEIVTHATDNAVHVERVSESGREVLRVDGHLRAGQPPFNVYRSTGAPERAAGELLRLFLQREGVAVTGQVRVTFEAEDRPLMPLVAHQGEPLGRLLDDVMGYSNNFMADVLLLGLAAERTAERPLHLPSAAAWLEDYAARLSAASRFAGTATAGLRLRDGSGLDPESRLAAQDLIALLDHMYHRSVDFPAFAGSLVVPAHALGRSLRNHDPHWMERLAVKSGGLSEPVSVTTLAGYLRFADGGWGAFAMLSNGPAGARIARAEVFEALRRDLAGLWQRP